MPQPTTATVDAYRDFETRFSTPKAFLGDAQTRRALDFGFLSFFHYIYIMRHLGNGAWLLIQDSFMFLTHLVQLGGYIRYT